MKKENRCLLSAALVVLSCVNLVLTLYRIHLLLEERERRHNRVLEKFNAYVEKLKARA